MKRLQPRLATLLLLAGLGVAPASHAALYTRLGGLAVYDDDFNITWLADANYAQTSGYDSDGLINWNTAMAWAAGLNIGGYTGWRLPTTLQPDPTCSSQSGGASDGYNCTGSELGHLFYTEGGLSQDQNITSSAVLSSLFTNMQNLYWSGTDYAPFPSNAWGFNTGIGFQGNGGSKDFSYYAWAVRNGDIGGGSVPEPGILGLMGIGALAWAAARRKPL